MPIQTTQTERAIKILNRRTVRSNKTILLANISASDAKFFDDLVEIFCDPENEQMACDIRSGTCVIRYAWRTGAAEISTPAIPEDADKIIAVDFSERQEAV